MDLPSFTTLILLRSEQISWQDLCLFNTRHYWTGLHVWFSRFSLLSLLLSCSSWATGTAPLNHSWITTNKSGWYLPSFSHTPVKTHFLLFYTSGCFQTTMSLVPYPGIIFLSHLQVIFPYTGPQWYPMEFLLRVAIIHGKRERTGSSLLSSLVPSLHTFTESLFSKSVTYKPSSWKLSNM